MVSPPKRRRSVIIQKGTLVELLAADEVETLVQSESMATRGRS